ncbi:CLUMA_CG003294, isoform A [Clunio marinus]|uniref:CLUMA_CG003294, isoform A n=1 Tax=Clunio marinus TaxID=568069 RepID=A0A1J1HN72_9DIPT|nr:CLUMA_CG003294, isoform A [Clunio marinus]
MIYTLVLIASRLEALHCLQRTRIKLRCLQVQ